MIRRLGAEKEGLEALVLPLEGTAGNLRRRRAAAQLQIPLTSPQLLIIIKRQ